MSIMPQAHPDGASPVLQYLKKREGRAVATLAGVPGPAPNGGLRVPLDLVIADGLSIRCEGLAEGPAAEDVRAVLASRPGRTRLPVLACPLSTPLPINGKPGPFQIGVLAMGNAALELRSVDAAWRRNTVPAPEHASRAPSAVQQVIDRLRQSREHTMDMEVGEAPAPSF